MDFSKAVSLRPLSLSGINVLKMITQMPNFELMRVIFYVVAKSISNLAWQELAELVELCPLTRDRILYNEWQDFFLALQMKTF